MPDRCYSLMFSDLALSEPLRVNGSLSDVKYFISLSPITRIQTLLQSSASRKTQKKKKKKVSGVAV